MIRECCYRGAAYVAGEIWRRFGVRRTVRAVEMRASRIRVSLVVQTECPECGAVGVVINRSTGLCRHCSERLHLAEERAFGDVLEAERQAAEDERAIADVRRERDAQRKRNSRTCKKYGLPTRRERGRGKG